MKNNDDRSFFSRLQQGLSKTRRGFIKNLDEMISGEKVISEDIFEDIEEILIGADLGPAFTFDLIEAMKYRAKRKELAHADALKALIKESMIEILKKCESPLKIPVGETFTIMVVGVNGTGKTTTIGKMASRFKRNKIPLMLVAADTFRAAAVEQLEIWAERVGAPIIKQKMGADPSAVVYDAIHATKSKEAVMLIDTAGRLHTKTNLMDELKKIKRIMGRELEGAPHETLLVLDATTGQNAVLQAKMFHEAIGVTGIVITKLDGTAKGGIIIRIAQELEIPIRYIGVGEGLDDLRRFKSEEFVDALFE
ncbi:MAG TPA: signal recognition particle-docking protein FtsY [Syntrophales bacterium]|nr:signal recognition particle-docking protein FtsY [Syntrophales bacterium]HPQ44268.1 signal recognition particle-docking protein FtsY [Syntrophales bacterium]